MDGMSIFLEVLRWEEAFMVKVKKVLPTFINHCHNLVYDFGDPRLGSVIQHGEFVLVTSKPEPSEVRLRALTGSTYQDGV
jgi:hypothetical protein